MVKTWFFSIVLWSNIWILELCSFFEKKKKTSMKSSKTWWENWRKKNIVNLFDLIKKKNKTQVQNKYAHNQKSYHILIHFDRGCAFICFINTCFSMEQIKNWIKWAQIYTFAERFLSKYTWKYLRKKISVKF